MRLVCPNCAAQYEVDDNAIPKTGRDVQCASCGNTWFQEPPSVKTQAAPDPEDDAFPEAGSTDQTPDNQDGEIKDDTPKILPPSPAGGLKENSPDQSPTLPRPARTPHDPSVLDILRREAEREKKARKLEELSQAQPPEQTDKDAHVAVPTGRRHWPEEGQYELSGEAHLKAGQADTSTAHERGEQAEASTHLPDIDELNSTLRAANDKSRRTEQPTEQSVDVGSGRLGFYLALLLLLIFLLAYVLRAQIINAAPGTAPLLETYAEIVDAGRRALASGAAALIAAIRNLIG